MKEIGLISDSHGFIDDPVLNQLSKCDEIWHAGDIGNIKVLDDLIGFKKTNAIDFIEENISIKKIDYYYTNSIARSSKVMSECRQISKRFLFTGIEKES